jgi:hypothetical protein
MIEEICKGGQHRTAEHNIREQWPMEAHPNYPPIRALLASF